MTNTRRYGVNASLIYDLDAHNTFRVAYTNDYGRHRQTGAYGYLTDDGTPYDPFGGKDGHGRKVYAADRSFLRARDRFSIAQLQQVAGEYRGRFFDDRLVLNLGVRAPFFKRELDQNCYSQLNSSNVRCTTEDPAATLANGDVTFANVLGSNGAPIEYIAPYQSTKKYHKVLPNVGVSYEFIPNSTVYASFAQGLSAPRTDSLYTVTRDADGEITNPTVKPEQTNAYDLGYRYSDGKLIASVDAWGINYKNRIVNSYYDDLGYYVDRNVGKVDEWGVDAQAGYSWRDKVNVYGTVSYIDTDLKDNITVGAGQVLPTKGKELVETPHWQVGGRIEWRPIDPFRIGFQGKYVSRRYATDVNDESVKGYEVFDLDARLDLGFMHVNNAYLQFNVSNLFDKNYLGSISSTQTNAATVYTPAPRAGSTPYYYIGAPRTFQGSLVVKF